MTLRFPLKTQFPYRYYLAVLIPAGILPSLFIGLFGIANGVWDAANTPPAVALLWSTLLSIFNTVVIGTVVVLYVEWLRVKVPWKQGITRRFLLEFFGTNLLAGLTMVGLVTLVRRCGLYDFLVIPDTDPNLELLNNVLIALLMNCLLTVLFEGIMFFREFQQAETRAERLEKEKLQGQLDILQAQLQPHFLFNSLNVLSSLIHIDTKKSDQFITAFAKIYRYVLDTYQKPVVSLHEEVAFVRNYLFLQELRFGTKLQMNWDEESFDQADGDLPPLSIQICLENSLKHNEASETHPLKISLSVLDGRVHIRNNLHPPTSAIVSTGLGQKNLIQRYDLIGAAEFPRFGVEGSQYHATLPLINPES